MTLPATTSRTEIRDVIPVLGLGTWPHTGSRATAIGSSGAIASVLEFPEGREGVNELWTVPGELDLGTGFSAEIDANLDVGDVNAGLADFHTLQVQDFADAIVTGRSPAVTGCDARASLAIVAGIYESSRTGRVVELSGAPALITEGS